MSRVIGIGGSAALVLAGVVLAVAGVHVVAFALAAVGLCRAAAVGDAHRPRPDQPAGAPPEPPPRTPYEVVACALVELQVEHATLFAGDVAERLRPISRGHLDTRADAEPPELHER